jgi:hypothetical protein
MLQRRRHSRDAFTLLEALVASTILLVAIMGITAPIVAGARSEQEDARKTIATSLATELMEEILTKAFNDAGMGHENGETRPQYNCINDYNNYTELAGHIINSAGQIVTDPAAAGLSRTVTVTYVLVSPQTTGPASFASIVVSVKYGGQTLVSLTRLVYQSS